MKIFSSHIVAAVFGAILTTVAVAESAAPQGKASTIELTQEAAQKLREALEVSPMNLKVKSVETSEIPGMYAVQFINGPLVYATQAGDYFIVGDLHAVGADGYVNLTEKRRDGDRLEQMAGVATEDMIVFAAEGETRAYINVFTDVTCFYCQKLHQEVPALNKKGVEVRYLAYPRAGLSSDGYTKLASAWCADNPQESLTRLKAKQSIPTKDCEGNPIAEQFLLGQQMGVRGTPAIVTQTGQLIPGYQSADELMVTLGLN